MAASVTDRFLRYVVIDTQSDAASKSQPSTEKQKDLGRLLVDELLSIGVSDAHLDEHGYVYGTIPSNTPKNNVPVICLCSHMDTAPDFSGTNVKPQIVRNYQGGDIRLPGDSTQVIRVADHPVLKDMKPETTKGRDGFIHPTGLSGVMEKANVNFIVRDFTEEGLKTKEAFLENITRAVMESYPGSSYTFTVKEQYRNMKEVLDQRPEIVEYAVEAIRRAGMEPVRSSIRGGTDGSRLSFMGLPCANIFAGGHAFHSPLEFVSHQDMEKAVNTIVELAKIWEERA